MIPKKVNICGLQHKVIYPYIFENTEILGLYERLQATIKITNITNNCIRPIQCIYETLIHEMFHGIDYIICNNTVKHEIITDLSIGWYQVLVDNNLFNSKNIPKKVKVGGYLYDVQFPHVFKDEETIWGSVNNNLLWMRLSSKDSTGKFDADFLKQQLIYLTTCAIIGVYCEDTFDTLIPFSFGVYQVFNDNNIEKLIKSGVKK